MSSGSRCFEDSTTGVRLATIPPASTGSEQMSQIGHWNQNETQHIQAWYFFAETCLGSSSTNERREIHMKAAVLTSPGRVLDRPLRIEELSRPEPGAGQVLLRVLACGVCRTDLHIIEGELAPLQARVIPGHQNRGRDYQRSSPRTFFGSQSGSLLDRRHGRRVLVLQKEP